MFAFIEGRVEEKRAGELVLNAHGVGYLLLCPASTVAAAPAMGEHMRAYTHLSVREDAMELFGFATREERTMFQKLCSVGGIGPRTALGILSSMPVRDLSIALIMGDLTALSRAPGIGKKTAQRMVLELK
ncbi:MAG: Holliday junction branch migration protein RuvA, partial [Clostridia bacterium]